MSKNKGFSETSAGRYSLALYELAIEANNLSEIEAHSASIINLIASSEDFNSLIKDPTNNKEDQLNALNKISEQYKLNELLTKFLSFLISKRRFFYVDKILKSFLETCSIKRGELKAELTSAKDLKISAVVSPCIKFNILIRSGLDRPRFGGRGSIILPPPIVRCAD